MTAPPPSFEDSILLQDIQFTYPERSEPALNRINILIPKGLRVALTGRTGSGKSTLADVIMGLLQPDAGRILIDGRPLTDANRASWRQNLAHVPQAIFLADATIAENIAFGVEGDRIDAQSLEHAVRTAQLEQLIASLPDGLETRVGERGARLSGGQRQRLALARAIYREKPILVLDEATSALDSATEASIIAALDEIQREGVTILIIAHRETSIIGCDMRIHLDHGRRVPVPAEPGASRSSPAI